MSIYHSRESGQVASSYDCRQSVGQSRRNCIPAAGSWQVDEPPQPRTETTSGMVLVRPGQLEVGPEASGGVNARTDENVDDHFAKARLRVVK